MRQVAADLKGAKLSGVGGSMARGSGPLQGGAAAKVQ